MEIASTYVRISVVNAAIAWVTTIRPYLSICQSILAFRDYLGGLLFRIVLLVKSNPLKAKRKGRLHYVDAFKNKKTRIYFTLYFGQKKLCMIPYYVDAFKNKKITENGGIFKNSTDLGCNQLVICDVIINYIHAKS